MVSVSVFPKRGLTPVAADWLGASPFWLNSQAPIVRLLGWQGAAVAAELLSDSLTPDYALWSQLLRVCTLFPFSFSVR